MSSRSRSRQQEIADSIRTQILTGELCPGDSLGTTADLQDEHDVSEIVIRGALQILTRMELVTSRRGRGYWVAHRTITKQVTEDRYRRPRTEKGHCAYRARRIMAPPLIAQRLKLGDDADVVAIELTYRDTAAGEVIYVADCYEPVDLVGDTPAEVTGSGTGTRGEDVIGRLASIGILLDGDQVLEETHARLATHSEADRLGIPPGAAIMHTISTYLDASGRPVSTTETLLPGSRFVRVDRIAIHLDPR